MIDGNHSEMSIEFEDNPDESAEVVQLPAEIVSLCSLSPTKVVAGCMDDSAYVCHVDDEYKLQIVATLSGHSDTVVSVQKNPVYEVFATGSYDCTVRVYSAETLHLVCVLEGPSSEIEFIRFDDSGERLLAGCVDGAAWLWHLSFSGNSDFAIVKQSVLTGHTDAVTNGVFIAYGKKALTIALDGCAIIWDLDTSKTIHRIRAPGHSPMVSLAQGRQSGTIMIGCDSGMLIALAIESGKIVNQVQVGDNSIECMAFDTKGNFLATGSTDGFLVIKENSRLFASQVRHRIQLGAGIAALAWHEMENLVFVTTTNGEFAVFCPLTGATVLKLQGGTEPLLALSLGKLPNGQAAVFVGGDDACLRMFALQLEEDDAEDDLAKPAVP